MQKPGQQYVPTAEADAGAGKILIWKEGITGDVLIWNVPTEAVTQGLAQGRKVTTTKLLAGKTAVSNQPPSPGEPCRWRRQRVASEYCCYPAAAPGCAAGRWSPLGGCRSEFLDSGGNWKLLDTDPASWNAPGEDDLLILQACLKKDKKQTHKEDCSTLQGSHRRASWTWSQELCVNRLVEDEYCGTQSRQRDVQAAASGSRLQLLGEMFQVGIRCIAKELEEIVVEAVRVGSIDDYIRDGQDFKEQPCTLTLIGTWRDEGKIDLLESNSATMGPQVCLILTFCIIPAPSRPSVSMTTTRWTGSIAAHTPTVQDSCVGEVLNTSRPRKKVWFRVWDLPSPVFPKIETTFRSSLGLQASLLTNSSSSFTWGWTQHQPCWQGNATLTCFQKAGMQQLTCISSLSSTKRKLQTFSTSALRVSICDMPALVSSAALAGG